MNNEEISLSLWQGEMHLSIRVPKIVQQKAEEIQKRHPQGTFDKEGLTLINQAYDELKAEGVEFPKAQ